MIRGMWRCGKCENKKTINNNQCSNERNQASQNQQSEIVKLC